MTAHTSKSIGFRPSVSVRAGCRTLRRFLLSLHRIAQIARRTLRQHAMSTMSRLPIRAQRKTPRCCNYVQCDVFIYILNLIKMAYCHTKVFFSQLPEGDPAGLKSLVAKSGEMSSALLTIVQHWLTCIPGLIKRLRQIPIPGRNHASHSSLRRHGFRCRYKPNPCRRQVQVNHGPSPRRNRHPCHLR